MNPIARADTREAEIAEVLKTEEDRAAFQQHLTEVIEGPAFKGSYRSGQFLRYIVDHAMAGDFDCLKERVIGIELWGKAPSYDTNVDAIVRVTASDVRKRLLRHYERHGNESEFRILLPSGSYIPEIVRTSSLRTSPLQERPEASPPLGQAAAASSAIVVAAAETNEVSLPQVALPEIASADLRSRKERVFLYVALGVLTLGLAAEGILWSRSSARAAVPPVLPWSVFLSSPRTLRLITSDPDMAQVEEDTNIQVSLSDYANHKYLPTNLDPARHQLMNFILQENESSPSDVPIAVSVAELSQSYGKRIETHNTRSLNFSDLRNDDNFILLGSPLSNPWSDFFSDQLDFRFGWNPDLNREVIRNLHPRANERAEYVPTALGWATGQSYAIAAFVQNPDQKGHVLLLAGESAEGTEAAAKLLTDLPRLSATLRGCGILPGGPVQPFELLLALNIMAGSPSNMSVVACHLLPGNSTHTANN